jgi:hypothetical protein
VGVKETILAALEVSLLFVAICLVLVKSSNIRFLSARSDVQARTRVCVRTSLPRLYLTSQKEPGTSLPMRSVTTFFVVTCWSSICKMLATEVRLSSIAPVVEVKVGKLEYRKDDVALVEFLAHVRWSSSEHVINGDILHHQSYGALGVVRSICQVAQSYKDDECANWRLIGSFIMRVSSTASLS